MSMMNKEWFDNYFKEQWDEVKDCDIDFSQHEPISTANSLHIFEERYCIGDDEYRLLYAIGDDSNTPMIEILKKNEMEDKDIRVKGGEEMMFEASKAIILIRLEKRKQELEDLAWQVFQDTTGISFRRELTAEEKKSVTDVPEYQQYRDKAKRLYAKRLAKREKAVLNKKYPVIDVPASGQRRRMGGAYTLCFVYSKFDGNFVLRGYSAEVEEYLKKNYTHYFYNLSLWYHGDNRDIWRFWKDDVMVHQPHRDSKIFKGKDRWKWQVKPYTGCHSWDDDYEEKKKLAEEKQLWFKRMPKRWIPEFDEL